MEILSPDAPRANTGMPIGGGGGENVLISTAGHFFGILARLLPWKMALWKALSFAAGTEVSWRGGLLSSEHSMHPR